ncbi:hypothetical protein CEF21_20810 [Bacillus sp. FJAT-42376]|uniref:ADP-ribosyltransferase n=1 Tax=Bacillus sp. FJAT-42376 TaxID=2014076 RepID=UPI000F4F3FFE|nr:ADP-ribosyltransferase [Bacillus sp. FJAT-42376]AZB44532.1 hypothetical protein CEF21_20810 [Bacillus sp. FJAT-42376]
MGKVYDSSRLFTAIDARISQYHTLNGKLNSLEKKFQALVDNAEFQGKGADNIKAFYQAQIDLVGDWKKLIEHLLAFYQAVPGYAGDANLSDDSRLVIPFLEEQLETGSKNSQSLVDSQHSELKAILGSIEDIISLTPFSKESFETNRQKADKKRTETVEALNDLDEGTLIGRYMDSMDAQSAVQQAYIAIMEATSKGGTVQPINFNAKAYQANAIQDVRKSVSEKVKTFKDQETKAKQIREEIAAEKARIEAEKARIEAEKNKPWYEKAVDGVKTFAGEFSGYYDSVRATTGVDPVTGRKLSDAERVAAGAMAAAGFIPVVGWAGRAIKGGSALYKTAKGLSTATHLLDSYKGVKAMDILNKTEKGIYGLYTANSAWEFGTGEDMFGNQLTEEQRQQAMWNGLTMGLIGGGSHFIDKGGLQKLGSKFPYSTELVKSKLIKADETLKQIGSRVGSKVGEAFRSAAGTANRYISTANETMRNTVKRVANIPVPVNVKVWNADTNGVKLPLVDVEKRPLGEILTKFSSNSGRGTDSLPRETIQTLDEAHKWGEKHYSSWLDNLSDREVEALKQYTGNDYSKINRYLRGTSDSLHGVDPSVIQDLTSSLYKAQVPHEIKVFRGTDMGPLDEMITLNDEGRIIAEELVGKTFIDYGFTSTSITKSASFQNLPVSWEINVPKGAHGAYLGQISHFPDEAELLLQARQEMVIRKAFLDNDDRLYIKLDFA